MQSLYKFLLAYVEKLNFLSFAFAFFFFSLFVHGWGTSFSLLFFPAENEDALTYVAKGSDFLFHMAGARLVSEGTPALIYKPATFGEAIHDLRTDEASAQNGSGKPVVHKMSTLENAEQKTPREPRRRGFVYPPTFAMYISPLSQLSIEEAYLWFVGLSLAAYLVSVIMWSISSRVGLPATSALLSTPAIGLSLFAGQNGILVAALISGGLALLYRSQFAAGVLFGLACFKPQFGILLPLLLLAGRCYTAFISAAVTVLVLVGTSVALMGIETWIAFFTFSPGSVSDILNSAYLWPRMYGLLAMVLESGAPYQVAIFLQAVSAVTAATIAALVWRQTWSLGLRVASAIFATYASLPLVYDYDTVLLVLAIVGLYLYRTDGKWIALASPVAFLLYILPFYYPPIGFSVEGSVLVAPALVWSLLILTFLLSREEQARNWTPNAELKGNQKNSPASSNNNLGAPSSGQLVSSSSSFDKGQPA